ncbi:MAG: hypothetical protein RSC93_08845 [Erysipelotrichaceae bacterium]
MKRVIIITHDTLAEAYYETLKNFISDISNVEWFSLTANLSLENLEKEVNSSINDSDTYFIVTDLGIASSTKVAVHVAKGHENVFVLTGLNMMLLVSLLTTEIDGSVQEFIKDITAVAKADIISWSNKK